MLSTKDSAKSTDVLDVTLIGGPLNERHERLPRGIRWYWQAGAMYEISAFGFGGDDNIERQNKVNAFFREKFVYDEHAATQRTAPC